MSAEIERQKSLIKNQGSEFELNAGGAGVGQLRYGAFWDKQFETSRRHKARIFGKSFPGTFAPIFLCVHSRPFVVIFSR
ncbi:MAG: hypothetical protein ACREFE_07035 [Limisphaerales bacterium]